MVSCISIALKDENKKLIKSTQITQVVFFFFFLLLRLIKTVPKIMRISENNNLKQITTYQFQYISPIPWYIFVFTFVNIINIKW